MFALKAKLLGSMKAVQTGALHEERFVLPRIARRPVRFFSRMLQGDVAVPRYATAGLNVAVLGGAVLYGSIIGGQFGDAVESVSAEMGFAVSEIEIAGNTHTSINDVYHALGLNGRRSLISIDAGEARAALKKLPWIDTARIAKVYPNKLEIDVTERDAFAVWQQGEALTVVEADGTVIGGYAGDARLAALPLLVGKGAAAAGKDFVAEVAKFSDIAPRVRAYIRVGTRRWNLRLDNGVTVRLPEHGVDDALGRLTAMQAELGVIDRDIAAIDLRMKDRTVFALTENARTTRDAFVKARSEAAKKVRKARGSRI